MVQLSVQGSFWIVDVDDRVPSEFAVKTNFELTVRFTVTPTGRLVDFENAGSTRCLRALPP